MLLTRSAVEARLAIALASCPNGGDGYTVYQHSIVGSGQQQVWAYDTRCPHCGAQRRFEFRAHAHPPPYPAFGGAEPSQLLDAGQFLATAEAAAQQVSVDDYHPEARESIALALAAIEEILKFIPHGGDAVPRTALRTPASLARFDTSPEDFSRRSVLARKGTYLQAVTHPPT